MQSIQQMIQTVLENPKAVVLAIIVNVEGSSYRKEGTWMLIQEDGKRIGVISGGCLENDIHERANDLFNTGKAEIMQYDLRAEDDLGWGRGMGCNGIVTVFLRDIDSDYRSFLDFAQKRLLANEPMYIIHSIKKFNQYGCIDQQGKVFGTIELEIPQLSDELLPFQTITNSLINDDDVFFFQLIWPQPKLYIVGAGIDAQPLAHLAERVGYAVHLFDWRSELCNKKNFPSATSFHVGDVEELISNVLFNPLDSVVLMTHDFQLDAKIIQHLLQCETLYIGVLGSKERTARLLGKNIPSKIHSPVGLSIGADGPEEIAVSIVAELIAQRQGKML
ncbi:xanthine dehydrogenase [Sporosarcina sp. P13]|uniref:XdhC family protein n=1 Tax=Sporosarcina sp. P13 TaxID=2048263 RepID=UPI000C1694D6|nr:XdhC family protein [Sporosarcina sp. P13]PIC64863.1 xanthine dehydrogenase [Sporosarcina sp. P13]